MVTIYKGMHVQLGVGSRNRIFSLNRNDFRQRIPIVERIYLALISLHRSFCDTLRNEQAYYLFIIFMKD